MAEDYKPGQEPFPEQDDRKLFCKYHYKGVLIVTIPLVFAPLWIIHPYLAFRMLYLAICVYLYYIFNVMSQGATAFLFIIFLPLCGITPSKAACVAHYTNLVFATYGCMFMGIMMDVSKLSERLAMIFIGICGTRIRLFQAGLLLVCFVSSILIDSTFMAAFWMKVAQAVVAEYANAGALVAVSEEEPYERQSKPYPSRPVVGIYLTVAYGCTFGAMVSAFQSPNDQVYRTLSKSYLVGPSSVFVLFILPCLFGLALTALWINIIFLGLLGGSVKQEIRAAAAAKDATKQAMIDKKAAMGPWNVHALLTLIMIGFTMIILFTRDPIVFSGWNNSIKVDCGSSVAIVGMCVLYFSVPANYFFCRYYMCRQPQKEATAPSLVGWKTANINTPWAHVFMMTAGYGFLIGYKDSGLLKLVTTGMVKGEYSKFGCFMAGSLLGTLITNLAPATGVAHMTLEEMTEVGTSLGFGAATVGLPYAAALHNQFLLPVATTSNTIVAGWGNVRPFQFLLGGCVPTLCMFLLLGAFTQMLGGSVFLGY